MPTEDEAREDAELADILAEHNATTCPGCGRTIDRGDLAWNEASTEAGTPMTGVVIICQGCDTHIADVRSWYPSVDSFEDVLHILDQDWK